MPSEPPAPASQSACRRSRAALALAAGQAPVLEGLQGQTHRGGCAFLPDHPHKSAHSALQKANQNFRLVFCVVIRTVFETEVFRFNS